MDRHHQKIGLAHFSAIGLAPDALVAAASDAGFDAVGLRLFPAFPGAPCYSVPQGSAAARDLHARLDATGVEVFDIEFVVIDADFRPQAVLRVLEDAAALGAQRLSACGQDADRARLTDHFAELCDVAGQVGMSVDLENMGWRPVRSLQDSVDVVSACGRPNAGVLVDALHLFRNGGTLDQISGLPQQLIRHAQLCDVRGPAPTTDETRIQEARSGRLSPGEGELPLAALAARLPASARISVEVPLGPDQSVPNHLSTLMAGAKKVLNLT